MEGTDSVYLKLQKHLNRQPVGFPATRSGAETRILKHIFTPEEAAIALCLSYKLESLEAIFAKAGLLVESIAGLEQILERLRKKGGVESKTQNGVKHYGCIPLIVGMYEFQLERLTPDFIRDFNDYTKSREFGIEFLSAKVPQMRTIPVAQSIESRQHIGNFDDVKALLQTATGPFTIFECICRKKKAMEGEPCKLTERKETCLAVGHFAQTTLDIGAGREITSEEAVAIIEENQKEGLVLQPSNTEKAEFICSCCGCCCGMLGLQKNLPKPLDFWASNFQAAVDPEKCKACGACEKRCQVGAVRVSENKEQAGVDLNRCIGCGVCVSGCPTGALSLLKKKTEVIPPETREDLFNVIMANKKGSFGKMMLTGKLILDSVMNRRTGPLK